MKPRVGFKELVRRAEEQIESITAADALTESAADDVVFVDLRDIRELYREGKIPGAKHIPRGMLEFWVDPESPYHKPLFTEPHRFIFYCNLGWRSAMATQVAQEMGLENACHIDGGFEAWKEAGGDVEAVEKR